MTNQYLWTLFINFSALKGSLRLFFSVFMLAVTPFANAIVITLEPDDVGVGGELKNAHVQVAYVDDTVNGQSWDNVLTVRDGSDPDYVAPTGNLIFGAFPFMVYDKDPKRTYGGLGFKFHQDVFRVSLLANSIYPPGDLAAVWKAFDIDGNEIANGYAGGDRPASETFEINVHAKGIRTLIMGGDVSTAAICFDNLVFEFDENPSAVSEPNLMMLILMGFVIAVARAQFGQPSKVA